MKMLRFLFSKLFLLQLGIALALMVTLLWFVNRYLVKITLHGQTITVPDLQGLPAAGLDTFLKVRDLRCEIMDSVYNPKTLKGTVVSHDPPPGAQVKQNRKIYIVVNAHHPPKVKMPALVDLSLRQAIEVIATLGFKVGNLEYTDDIARNAVISQRINDRDVEPGMLVPRGMVIDLVLGNGLGSASVPVPDLKGMTPAEAENTLKTASLNLGALIRDESISGSSDLPRSKVWKQEPIPTTSNELVPMGSYVDVWVTLNNK